MKPNLFLLVTLLMADTVSSQCRTANWWGSFDRKGWSKCGATTEYVTGFYRNNKRNDDPIFLLEEAKCCKAPAPNQNRASTCKNANWWGVLDSNNRWALCPNGYFLQGLYRNTGNSLHHIEEGHCCKPNNLPSSYLRCYDHDVGKSFDSKGWSQCDSEYYMAGFYKGGCDKLYCIEKFRCCMMYDGCKFANWWGAFDHKGWVQCDSSKHYITGLWRNNNRGSNDKIFLLEEAKCCPAPSPNQNTASKCKTANWWAVLDKTNSWAVCPNGYFVQGFYRGSGDWLHNIEEAKCCKPNTFPDRYEHCYNENILSSFDNKGLSKCKQEGYYVAGIYRGGCDRLYCIETLKCCKMNVDECKISNPCKNGGVCSDRAGSYHCSCKSGYHGNNCQYDVNECANNPCKNGATCVNVQGSYRCDCKNGYTGNNCETNINECSPSPCQNGATCVDLVGSYRCDCKTGYSGNNCQTDINECSPNPCQNGATCVDLVASYHCDCKTGYSGNNCQTNINDCSPDPCQNGGTCVDLVGSYRCDCKTGYSGNTCQTNINDCSPDPCQNGGTCVDLVGSYRCDCKTGYSGNTCQTNINDCSPDPCQNGGTCVDLVGSYRCDCKTGYSGNTCQTNINDCSPDPCQNGGTCVDLVGSYRCDCKTGYSGTNCETNGNECSPDPCQNGGKCVDLVGSYRCDCKTGYSGTNCETDINECAPAPCRNGGTCVDLIGSYHCDCATGWLGTTCEEPEIDECEE